MARPRKHNNAEELQKLIDGFFAKAAEDDIPPIWEDLLTLMGISKNTWDSYKDPVITDNITESEKVNIIAVSEVIKKAEQKFTAEMAKFGLRHPNRQSMAMFLLKQKHYGGYTDKQEIEHKDLKIDVKINGINGNPFA